MGRSYKKADKCNAAVRGKALISEVELHRGWRWSEDFQMKGDQVRLFYRCTNMSRIATWHQCIAIRNALPASVHCIGKFYILCRLWFSPWIHGIFSIKHLKDCNDPFLKIWFWNMTYYSGKSSGLTPLVVQGYQLWSSWISNCQSVLGSYGRHYFLRLPPVMMKMEAGRWGQLGVKWALEAASQPGLEPAEPGRDHTHHQFWGRFNRTGGI